MQAKFAMFYDCRLQACFCFRGGAAGFAVETLVPGHCHLHSLKLNLPEAKAYFDWELPNEANCKLNVSAMGVC